MGILLHGSYGPGKTREFNSTSGKPGNSYPSHGKPREIVEFVEINIAQTINIDNIVGPYKLLPVVYLLSIS